MSYLLPACSHQAGLGLSFESVIADRIYAKKPEGITVAMQHCERFLLVIYNRFVVARTVGLMVYLDMMTSVLWQSPWDFHEKATFEQPFNTRRTDRSTKSMNPTIKRANRASYRADSDTKEHVREIGRSYLIQRTKDDERALRARGRQHNVHPCVLRSAANAQLTAMYDVATQPNSKIWFLNIATT
eukprot:3364623-Pleurochrysis_carterae.AAC.2